MQFRLMIHSEDKGIPNFQLITVDRLEEGGDVTRLFSILVNYKESREILLQPGIAEEEFDALTNGKINWRNTESLFLSKYAIGVLSQSLLEHLYQPKTIL